MASRLAAMVNHVRPGMDRMDQDPTVPDARYPAYPAATQDARLVTDYRPQCTKNIRTGQQFFTKKWMIANADALMDESRRRQVSHLGASLPMAHTVPPPAVVVHSTPFSSEAHMVHPYGIGTVRADATAPALFGTFQYSPSLANALGNRKQIALTAREEGGRNARRGA